MRPGRERCGDTGPGDDASLDLNRVANPETGAYGPDASAAACGPPRLPATEVPWSDLSERPACASQGRLRGGSLAYDPILRLLVPGVQSESLTTVATRFLEFDGVGPKIANMAVKMLIRDFNVEVPPPISDIAVDTHVLRVFERLGLLRSLAHSGLRSTKPRQRLRLQPRARELSPKWSGELDWPACHIGRTWCYARRPPDCGRCRMKAVCPLIGVAYSVPHTSA